MNKKKYCILIVFMSLFIFPIFLKETSQANVFVHSFGFVSVPYYCAAASDCEGETEVTAHIDPVNSERTDPPENSGSALMQKDENTSEEQSEKSEKTGKPVRTEDLLFEQILLFIIMIVLSFTVILLLKVRHQCDSFEK